MISGVQSAYQCARTMECTLTSIYLLTGEIQAAFTDYLTLTCIILSILVLYRHILDMFKSSASGHVDECPRKPMTEECLVSQAGRSLRPNSLDSFLAIGNKNKRRNVCKIPAGQTLFGISRSLEFAYNHSTYK
jgi:hypothetical protein